MLDLFYAKNFIINFINKEKIIKVFILGESYY